MDYNLIAYAQDFSSFLLQNTKKPNKIEKIILFGSIVRGEAEKSSDIDIFIETRDKIEIENLKKKFYESIKFRKYWSLLGIKNEIHCEAGILDEWQDLEKSLIAQGIILYGKYKTQKQGNPNYLFSVEQGKDRNKNISIWRRLYGYKQLANKKTYEKVILILIVLLVLVGAYQLFNLLNPTDLIGKAYTSIGVVSDNELNVNDKSPSTTYKFSYNDKNYLLSLGSVKTLADNSKALSEIKVDTCEQKETICNNNKDDYCDEKIDKADNDCILPVASGSGTGTGSETGSSGSSGNDAK